MTIVCSENDLEPDMQLAAILHDGDQLGDNAMSNIAGRLQDAGHRVGGVVQSNTLRPGLFHCDMELRELTSGRIFPISQNLGNKSSGCRLDSAALEHVVGLVEAAVRTGLDILILNKFGKQEAEGKGLRNAIVLAADAGIPVLVGLNRGNCDTWIEFCGDEGRLFDINSPKVEQWLASVLAGSGQVAPIT